MKTASYTNNNHPCISWNTKHELVFHPKIDFSQATDSIDILLKCINCNEVFSFHTPIDYIIKLGE